MAVLIQFGVVEKIQTYNGNIKGKVIYRLTHTVNVSNSRVPKNPETEKQKNTVSEKLGIRNNGIPRNEETKNNILKNNSINNKNTICASDNEPKASQSEINTFFESIWSLYPNKKGKGQVSDAKKRKLYAIGYDEISRAIDRYKDGLSQDGWRQPQNGSTFFNSGYVDYLDANYKADGQAGSRSDPLKDVPQETIDAIIRNASQPREYDPDGDPFQ